MYKTFKKKDNVPNLKKTQIISVASSQKAADWSEFRETTVAN